MFKLGNIEEELYRSMEKSLIVNQSEASHGINKLLQATQLLSQAADIFDRAGMISEAEELTAIIRGLAT
jgi:hypothetical protein